jgi:hypothetical protein
MRRPITCCIAMAAVALTLGCGEPTSPLDVFGSYSLQSVNGMPLPFALPQAGGTQVHLLDDVLFLSTSSTYSEAGHKLYTTGGVTSLAAPVDAGTFTRRGTAITMQSLLFGAWDGTVDHGTLTMVQAGYTLVYKQ